MNQAILKQLGELTSEYIVIRGDSAFEADTLADAITHQLHYGGTIYARFKTGHEVRADGTKTAA